VSFVIGVDVEFDVDGEAVVETGVVVGVAELVADKSEIVSVELD